MSPLRSPTPRLAPLLGLISLFGLLVACSERVQAPEPTRAVRSLVISAGSADLSHEYAGDIRARTESRLAMVREARSNGVCLPTIRMAA